MSQCNSEKILFIEKLNLTRNKQTNFNKLGPLSRVFQTVVGGKGLGEEREIWLGDFLLGGENLTWNDFDYLNLFQS